MDATVFDPLRTTIMSQDIRRLTDIARRARNILRARTSAEVRAAQSAASEWVQIYFESNIDEEKTRLRRRAEDGDARAAEYFENWVEYFDENDPHGIVHIGEFREHTVGDLDVSTEYNTSELQGLLDSIDSYDLDDGGFDAGRPYEYVAALSLKYVELALCSLRDYHDPTSDGRAADAAAHDLFESVKQRVSNSTELTPPLSVDLGAAIDYAIDAMEAIVSAEALVHEAELADRMRKNAVRTVNDALRERDEKLSLEKKERLKLMQKSRHAPRNSARQLVVSEWEKDPKRFPSAEKAGEYFAQWIGDRGYTFSSRTVRDWIRARASEIGIQWR